MVCVVIVLFKQKTAYELRISDWSSDVCSSDLLMIGEGPSARSVRIDLPPFTLVGATTRQGLLTTPLRDRFGIPVRLQFYTVDELELVVRRAARLLDLAITSDGAVEIARRRSEEHTSELQSLMRISYAVFCLKKKKRTTYTTKSVQTY